MEAGYERRRKASYQGELANAEKAFLSAVAEAKKSRNDELRVAKTLSRLAEVYVNDHKLADAENALKQALSVREQILKAGHTDIWKNLKDLSDVYEAEDKFEEAEASLKRAVIIRQRAVGPNHPDAADSLCNLAAFYGNDFGKKKQADFNQADILYKRALAITEKRFGAGSMPVADTLDQLTNLYDSWGKYAQAELFCRRAFPSTKICIKSWMNSKGQRVNMNRYKLNLITYVA